MTVSREQATAPPESQIGHYHCGCPIVQAPVERELYCGAVLAECPEHKKPIEILR